MVQTHLDYDRSLLGKDLPAGSFDVTKESISAYCTAVGETNPLFTDEKAARGAGHRGVVAPPTMCNVFIRGLNRPDVKLQGARMRMHGGQTVESLAPICAGDKLSAVTRLKDVYAKTGRTGTMAFIVWETEFTNQLGQRVALGRESFMARLQDQAPTGA